MSAEIQINQVLHGYRNGHQILASSLEFPFADRRLLDTMSDRAGIDPVNCPEGYITGYALPESEKYVLSKTWYADEMQRPGCVWTHSLILDMDSMGQIDSPGELLKLFRKPVLEKYDYYTVPIRMMQEDTLESVNLELLQYVVYTIYVTDQFRYVEIQDNCYGESVILALCHMPRQLLAKFSFCLDSLTNRYIDGSPFSYQMIRQENCYRIYPDTNENKLFQRKEGMSDSPAWAREYAKAVKQKQLNGMEKFMEIFCPYLNTFSAFNQFLRLYFITKELDGCCSLNEYYDILKKISLKNYKTYFECIIEELVSGDYFDKLFLDDFMEMIDIAEKNKKKFKKGDMDKIAKKILRRKVSKVPEFLSRYIHGTLGRQSDGIAQAIIKKAEPDNLRQISNMDHDIVMVAVAINSNLIMSDDIWTLPRNYQCDIINVVDSSISHSQWLKILSHIFKECKEDISEAVYNKAQEKLVPALLELFQNWETGWPLERAFIWDRYLLDDQVRLCQNLPKISQAELRLHWLLKINTYSDEIRNSISATDWTELFQLRDFEKGDRKKNMAIQILPLILESEHVFPEDIVVLAFKTLHQALAQSQLAYEEWKLVEGLLPEVDLCYAWDKCLRLRKAFQCKGYDVQQMLSQ